MEVPIIMKNNILNVFRHLAKLNIKSVVFKIAAILLFMTMITIIISIVGFIQIRDMNQVANDIFLSNSTILYPLSEALELIYKVDQMASRAIEGDSLALSQISTQMNNVTGQIGCFSAYLSQADIEKIQVLQNKYQRDLRDFYNEIRTNGPMASYLYSKFKNDSQNLYASLFTLGTQSRIKGLKTYSRGQKIYNSALTIQTWITVLGVLIAIFIGFMVANSIVQPLQKLRSTTELLAKGDLRVKAEIKSQDEVGAVATAFNRAIDELRLMVTEAAENAQHITTSSNELFKVTDETTHSLGDLSQLVSELATGATTQTQSVKSAIQLIQKATEDSNLVTTATIQINNVCKEASVAAERGGEATSEMTAAINSLVETVNKINHVVQNLAEDSTAIRKIVDVIREIAEKTSLLSLNASIEAARAGEHGRGFAVVASNIRQLSIQSRESVEQIDEVINNIFIKTDSAVMTMEQGTIQVDKSRNTLIETTNLYKELIKQVSQIIESIALITETADQMNVNNQVVITEMAKVSQISQDNLAAAEEVSATFQQQYASTMVVNDAAGQLQKMAEQLSTTANKFRK
jgi:methyl-accepting chemotaxis protein